MEMMTNTNNNFDMQTLMNIVGQSAMTTNQISQQLGIMANSVNTMRNDINGLKDDMEQIKLNEEITTTQQENIIEIARHRVCDILNFNDDDMYERLEDAALCGETLRCVGSLEGSYLYNIFNKMIVDAIIIKN